MTDQFFSCSWAFDLGRVRFAEVEVKASLYEISVHLSKFLSSLY